MEHKESNSPKNSATDRRLANLRPPFKKGDPKPPNSGKKLGYKSLTVQLREELQKLTDTKGGKKITFQTAIINKLMQKALVLGNDKAMQMIWEYMEGKPTQPIRGPGDDGEIVITWQK